MFNKFEMVFGAAAIASMALALYFIRLETLPQLAATQTATVLDSEGVIVVGDTGNVTEDRANALLAAADTRGNIERMVIDDVKIGAGETVKEGDTVFVHYIGTLQNGQEFDNSQKRGEPFEFTVGQGRVIAGWEQGLIGMQVGGERILVIPPELGYGEQGIGPIPGNATLIFAIELIEIR